MTTLQHCVCVQALKTNGSGEFEESLRVVVKCIYNPSKYYSKVIKSREPLDQYKKADCSVPVLIHSSALDISSYCREVCYLQIKGW